MLAPGSVMGRALGPLGTAGCLAAHPLAAGGWGGLTEQPPPAGGAAGRPDCGDTQWRSPNGFLCCKF